MAVVWFMSNSMMMLVLLLVAVWCYIVWVVEFKNDKPVRGFLFGLAISLSSFFFVGLWCFIVVALYVLSCYVFEYFYFRRLGK